MRPYGPEGSCKDEGGIQAENNGRQALELAHGDGEGGIDQQAARQAQHEIARHTCDEQHRQGGMASAGVSATRLRLPSMFRPTRMSTGAVAMAGMAVMSGQNTDDRANRTATTSAQACATSLDACKALDIGGDRAGSERGANDARGTVGTEGTMIESGFLGRSVQTGAVGDAHHGRGRVEEITQQEVQGDGDEQSEMGKIFVEIKGQEEVGRVVRPVQKLRGQMRDRAGRRLDEKGRPW